MAALTAEQQARVEIAQDALAWEGAGVLIANSQRYVIVENYPAIWQNDLQARDVVFGKCRVCVLGGLLLAKAVRFDRVSVADVRWGRLFPLREHFSAEQINQLEAAFEGRSYPGSNGARTAAYDGGVVVNWAWRKKYPETSQRFRAIMNNIIRNDGTFVPGDLG